MLEDVWKAIIFGLKGVTKYTTTLVRGPGSVRLYIAGWTNERVAGSSWRFHLIRVILLKFQ